jgi:hypothetical protein
VPNGFARACAVVHCRTSTISALPDINCRWVDFQVAMQGQGCASTHHQPAFALQAWKSNKMHWCDVCKCWLNDTKAAIAHHEQGMGHKANLARSESCCCTAVLHKIQCLLTLHPLGLYDWDMSNPLHAQLLREVPADLCNDTATQYTPIRPPQHVPDSDGCLVFVSQRSGR